MEALGPQQPSQHLHHAYRPGRSTAHRSPGAPTYTRRIRHHCPHCPRTFMSRIGLFGHLHIHESGIDRSPNTPSTPTHLARPQPANQRALRRQFHHAQHILHTQYAQPNPHPSLSASITTIVEADTGAADVSSPHCPPIFTSSIGLVSHLRIHHTGAGEPVAGAATYTRRIRLLCPHRTRTFIHSMGLLGHMHVHEDLG
nr:unnamed protein product [Spirometra erinaceieuropaei]